MFEAVEEVQGMPYGTYCDPCADTRDHLESAARDYRSVPYRWFRQKWPKRIFGFFCAVMLAGVFWESGPFTGLAVLCLWFTAMEGGRS